MGFVYLFLYFVVINNAITLFNCFFRDFHGFRDFRVFDLALCALSSAISIVDFEHMKSFEKPFKKVIFIHKQSHSLTGLHFFEPSNGVVS